MKHILLVLLLSCCVGYGQVDMNADEQEVLRLEVLRYKDDFINKYPDKAVTGDSIVINIKVLNYFKENRSYKQLAVDSGELPLKVVEEIFGTDGKVFFETLGEMASLNWNKNNFAGYKVFLFDEKRHSSAYATIKDRGIKIGIGTVSILSISKPIIRNDGKFAMIQTSSNHYGGVLSFYIKSNNKWELYKEMQLYLT